MKTSILFQPEYFRQSIYDLYNQTHIKFRHISSGDHNTIKIALEESIKEKVELLIIFRPEWLINHSDLVLKLKNQNCKIVGISTEPVPRDSQSLSDCHPDQLTRLNNLLAVNLLPFDLIVHYDESSKNFLHSKVNHQTIFLPLPLSSKLFNTESNNDSNSIEFDSIFLGRSTDYREKFLVLAKSFHRHLHVAHGLTDELSSEFIKKSKVSINIHNLPYSGYEVRVMQSLMCGVPVISERLTRDDINLSRGLYYFNDVSEFLELIKSNTAKAPIRNEINELWVKDYNASNWLSKIRDRLN